jgi:hypothetical protein
MSRMTRLFKSEMVDGSNEHADVQSSSMFYQAHNFSFVEHFRS